MTARAEMARVVRLHGLGGPEVLRVDAVAVPPPGPGEARIRVGAIGLNRIEAMFRAGGFGSPALPSRIGYEAAGVVESVGEGVEGIVAGDRVATLPGLSMEQYGTHGEVILYPADRLVTLPEDQPMAEAAATWMQYLTAYALVDAGQVGPDDAVVVTAASSSVGIAAIQIVNERGGVPIAVTRGQAKAAALIAAGAANVIVSDDEDVAAAVRTLTGGAGAAVLFDAVGGAGFAALAGGIRRGGIAIVYGALAGDELPVPAHMLMLGNLTVRGFSTDHLLADPVRRVAAIAYIRDGLASGALRPIIDRSFPLADIAEAHRYLEGNMQMGKIVVTID